MTPCSWTIVLEGKIIPVVKIANLFPSYILTHAWCSSPRSYGQLATEKDAAFRQENISMFLF